MAVGRPKIIENTRLKVTISETASQALEEACTLTDKTKSDIVRNLLTMVGQKDFELPNICLERMEKQAVKCWEDLHILGALFDATELPEGMPAFAGAFGSNKEISKVYVKYPTFKIQVASTASKDGCVRLLKENGLNTMVDVSEEVWIEEQGERLALPIIVILNIHLQESETLKDQICKVLKLAGYPYTVGNCFCLRAEIIDFINNETYFKVRR